MTSFPQTILMCPPDHFEVAYVINPWMEGHFANTDDALAHRQWSGLRDAIERHAKLALEPAQRDLPDIVFTANAGLVLGRKAIVSRFRSAERRARSRITAPGSRKAASKFWTGRRTFPLKGRATPYSIAGRPCYGSVTAFGQTPRCPRFWKKCWPQDGGAEFWSIRALSSRHLPVPFGGRVFAVFSGGLRRKIMRVD